VTVADSGRKVIFRPGGVRVSSAGVRGIVPRPPPVRSPGGGHGIGQGSGGGRGHGKGGGNSLAALALALGAVSATGGKVVPSPPIVAGAMTLICSQVLSAPQATFDTNTILSGNIPSTYKHLVIYLQGRTTSSGGVLYDGVLLRFNNDSGFNYFEVFTQIKGAAAVSSLQTSDSRAQIGGFPNTSGLAGAAGTIKAEVIGYGSAFHKNVRSWGNKMLATTPNTSWFMEEYAAYWLNTAAVTRITILNDGAGNFDTGSSFYLYGIT